MKRNFPDFLRMSALFPAPDILMEKKLKRAGMLLFLLQAVSVSWRVKWILSALVLYSKEQELFSEIIRNKTIVQAIYMV